VTLGSPVRVGGPEEPWIREVPIMLLRDFYWSKFKPLLRLKPTSRRSSLLGRRVFAGTHGKVVERLVPKPSSEAYTRLSVGTVVAGTCSHAFLRVDVNKTKSSKKGLQRSRGKRKPPETRGRYLSLRDRVVY
jgi:hypothetical protein